MALALTPKTRRQLTAAAGCAVFAGILVLLLGIYLALVFFGPVPGGAQIPARPSAPVLDDNPHLALGQPVDEDPSDDAVVVVKPWYALSFNRGRHGANWVAWRLEKADLGRVERYAGSFFPDPAIAARDQGTNHDYAGSHFDKGHLCPSADRTASAEAQEGTFSILNALPQTPALNRGPWEGLEKHLRKRARDGQRVFVVDGPMWGDSHSALGEHAIPIPTAFWKVAVVVCGTCGPADVAPGTEVVAAILPNDVELSPRWTAYQTTLGEVEHRSGYHLLGQVAEGVRNRLRTKIDMGGGR